MGNLVCPAEFDTGAVKNAMILSAPEGHDKPLKHPLIFQVCDVMIISRMDAWCDWLRQQVDAWRSDA